MIVSYLPEPETHPLWPEIKALLEPAVIDGEVLGEHELVWIAFDGPTLFGAATTRLFDDGEAEIVCCGGRHGKHWIGLGEAMVSAWARDCGARKITMRGRKGWGRALRPFGWVVSGVDDMTVYEKDLARE